VVCFDERPCQLTGEVSEPLPVKPPGHIERFDSEYGRGGVCWVLMGFEPLTGWREVVVTERRRKQEEFALALAAPGSATLPASLEDPGGLGQPLNSYTAAAFYESFSVEVARKLARRIEFIHTPVHGSWLNMVEIEVSVLVRHCLKRRLPDIATLSREAKAWTAQRNWAGASVEWSFTTEDARIKLRSPYPSVRKSDRGLVLRLFRPLGNEPNFYRPFGPCALASASSRVCRMEGGKTEDGKTGGAE
jgi:hypothetical protein